MKEIKYPEEFPFSTVRFLAMVALAVFLCEALILVLNAFFGVAHCSWDEAFIDAGILTFVAGPILYVLLYKPMLIYRRYSEEASRELAFNEQYLQSLINSQPECISLLDENGIIVDVSPSGLAMAEAEDARDLVGKDCIGMVEPEFREGFREFAKRVCSGKEETFVFVMTDLRGGRRWLESNAVPFRDEKNGRDLMLSVSRDITERKRAEEELAYSKEFLKSIIDNEPECVKLLDAEGTLIDMNASGLSMIGANSIEQVKGRNVYHMVAPEHRDAFKAHVEKVCRGEKSRMEFRAVGLKGKSIWLETHAVPFYDDIEKKTLLLAVTRDITERKRAEEELKEINTRLQTLFDAIPGSVFFKDAENRILVVNKGNEKLTGIKAEEMIGKTAGELLPADVAEQCNRSDVEAIMTRGIIRAEEYAHDKTIETIKSPFFDEDGNYKGMAVLAFDITERKRAENALKKSEAQLARAQKIAHVGHWEWDAVTDAVEWSDEVFRIYGLDSEKDTPTYETVVNTIPEALREKFLKAVEDAIRNDMPFEGEYQVIRPNGEVRDTFTAGQVRRDEFGNPTGMFGIVQDITQKKKSEEALKKSEEKYRGLFDTARDAIIIADTDTGDILTVNRAAETLLGRPASELIGMHQSELHPEEERELYRVAFREAVAMGKPVPPGPGREIYVVNSEGDRIPVEISVNVMELEGKKVIQGIFRDLTRRRIAERAAREGKQYLENVLNSIQDGLSIVARDFTVVMANPTIEKWYAHRGPVVGRKCYEVFKGKAEVCDPCPCATARDRGQSCFEIVNYHGPEGQDGTLELYAFPLSDPSTNEITGMIQYYRDITDRVALQAEALRAAQLASVGELAAGVAHEINNPINGIINYAQMLVNRLPEGSDENSISRRIIREGDRISGIVSALLTFTRDHGQVEELAHLEEMVMEALSLTVAQLSKDGIDVRIDIPADLPSVKARRQHLEQVFLNIINNARHALNLKYPEGNENKVIEIYGEAKTESEIPRVRITFTDHGVGIAAGIIEKVTDPFFTTKGAGTGTGLGLSISRSIIENHGGKLSLESAEGEYTRVIIDLPEGDAR